MTEAPSIKEAFGDWFDGNFLDPDGGSGHLPDWFRGDMKIAWDAALATLSQPTADRREIVALSDIAAERQRQKDIEGWAPEHDDTHDSAELAIAAGWYAFSAANPRGGECIGDSSKRDHELNSIFSGTYKVFRWPWSLEWWKPKDRRRDLVRAGALIVAEIERLDRLSALDGGRDA